MNRRQQINKILHDHIEVDKNTDYTNYKKLITAIEEWHEEQVESVDLADVGGSLPSTETCKVIPDNDEMFPCDVTDCCGIGPIVREKYCPECGKKIERQRSQLKNGFNG